MATQAQVVKLARDIQAAIATLAGLRATFRDLQVRKNNLSPDATWAAMATAAVNTDGTLAAKDASPVITNPIIDPAQIATPVYYLPSKTDLANAEGVIDAFLQLLDGTAAPAQVNRNGTIDKING
jgi:hypothetical protein